MTDMTNTAELKKAVKAASAAATAADTAAATATATAANSVAVALKSNKAADKKAAEAAEAAAEAAADTAAAATAAAERLGGLLWAVESAAAAMDAAMDAAAKADAAATAATAAAKADATATAATKALAAGIYSGGGLFAAFDNMEHAKLADGLIGKLAVANASASVKRQPSSSKTGSVADPSNMSGDRKLLHDMLVASVPVGDWNQLCDTFDAHKRGKASFEQSLSMMGRLWKNSGFGRIESDKLGSVIRIIIN